MSISSLFFNQDPQETQCEAHWPIAGRCKNKGRVEITTPDDIEHIKAIYCFDCVNRVLDPIAELADQMIWEEGPRVVDGE